MLARWMRPHRFRRTVSALVALLLFATPVGSALAEEAAPPPVTEPAPDPAASPESEPPVAKLGPEPRRVERDAKGRERIHNEVIVRTRPGAQAAAGLQALGAMAEPSRDPAVKLLKLPPGLTVEAALAQLSQDGAVLEAEPNWVRTIQAAPVNDTYTDQQWGLEAIQAYEAWTHLATNPPTGGTVVVAVVDTGVDVTHPDLAARMVLPGRNFVTVPESDDVTDEYGHGTHVAGIIAAQTDNALGVAGVTGTQDVMILPVKVLDAEGRATSWEIYQGIKWAADQGADIINMSFGGFGYSATEAEAVNYARDRGAVLVAAVGNNGVNGDNFYPAAFAGVIGVGAVDTNPIRRAAFSNWGRSVDLMAPGVNILSTIPDAVAGPSCEAPVCYEETGGYYKAWQGTSLATPYVAGAAALLKLAEPALTAEDVGQRLMGNALDMGNADYNGRGLLQIKQALAPGQQPADPAVQWVSPGNSATVWGMVELKVEVQDPTAVSSIRFLLDGAAMPAVGQPVAGTDQFSSYWDSSAASDGPHVLTAEALDAAGQVLPGGTATRSVTVSQQVAGGLKLQVLDAAGKPASGAEVAIFHRAPSAEASIPHWYEPAFQGRTDVEGKVVASGSFTTNLNDYTIFVWYQDPNQLDQGFLYVSELTAPNLMVIDGADTVPLAVTARNREGSPLSDAEVWLSYQDEYGVRLPYPLPGVNLNSQGAATLRVSPGRFDVHVRSAPAGYFLTNKEVTVADQGGAPLRVAFEPNTANSTRLTVGVANPAYTAEGYLYLWEPYFLFAYAVPVASGEAVVVSNTTAKPVVRFWLTDASNRTWNYLAEGSESLTLTGGNDRQLLLGGALTAAVQPVDDSIQAGETFSAGVRFLDDQHFFLRDIKWAQGGAGVTAARTMQMAVLGQGGRTDYYEWDGAATAWVAGSALGPKAVAALTWNYVDPVMRVYRVVAGSETKVHESSDFAYYHTVHWATPTTMATGAYRADLSLNAGPLGAPVGSSHFLVGSQVPTMTVTAPGGNPAAEATVRLIAWNSDLRRWQLVLAGELDAQGQMLLPGDLTLTPGQEYWLQVEGLVRHNGELQALGLHRRVSSMADLTQVDGTTARLVAVTMTFQNGEPIPGAELLAQPAPAGSQGLGAEERPFPLTLAPTVTGGLSQAWLDPGTYHINGTFHYVGAQATEAYWLLAPDVVVPSADTVTEVTLDGEQAGYFTIQPGLGVGRVALALYTDRVYTGMSYPFGPEGGRLYLSPDTYQPYATVMRDFGDAVWNYWVKTPGWESSPGISINPPTGGVRDSESFAFAADPGSPVLTLTNPQGLVPGTSTLDGTVAIRDAHGNQLYMVWVELRFPDRGMSRIAAGGPAVPDTALSHWETVPFLTITPAGSADQIAHYRNDGHFSAIHWPVPASLTDGSYTATLSLQVSPDQVIATSQPFGIGSRGVGITSPADGARVGSRNLTVTGFAPASAPVKLLLTPAATPNAWQQVATPTAAADGLWSAAITLPDSNEAYLLVARTYIAGKATDSSAVTVRLDTAAPGAPQLTARAWNAGEVELTWQGEPGKPIQNVLLYRATGQHTALPSGTQPTWSLPADARSYMDRSVAPQETYTYWVAYKDEAGRTVESGYDQARTPGLRLDEPAAGTLSGFVDLVASLEAPERAHSLRFTLSTAAGPAWSKVLTDPGHPATYRYQFNTTAVPDDAYTLTVESLTAAGAVIAEQAVPVTVANTVAGGLAFSIRNPDKTPAAQAHVELWEDDGNGGYLLAATGITDAHGRLTMAGDQAVSRKPYLVTVLTSQALFVRMVTPPGMVTIGEEQLVPLTVTALKRDGQPLSGARPWLVVHDDQGAPLPVSAAWTAPGAPLTNADGQWSLLVSPGTYDLRLLQSQAGYYLTRAGVAASAAPVAVTFDAAHTTQLTAAVDPSGAPADVAVLDHTGQPLVAGRQLALSPGKYPLGVTFSQAPWSYTLKSRTPIALSGQRLNLLVGGPMTVTLTPADVAVGESMVAGVAIADSHGFRLAAAANAGAPVVPTATVSFGGRQVWSNDSADYYEAIAYQVAAGAPTGTYSLEFELDAGLLGQLTGSAPFTVAGGLTRQLAVLDQTGAPAAAARVWVLSGSDLLFAGTTDAAGTLSIPDLPAGTYLVQVAHGAMGLSRMVSDFSLPVDGSTAQPVSLTVSKADGSPLVGARLSAQPVPAPGAALVPTLDLGAADANGEATLYLDEGSYHLVAATLSGGASPITEGYLLIAQDVAVPNGGTSVSLDGAATTLLTVSGAAEVSDLSLALFLDQLYAGIAMPVAAAGATVRVTPGDYRIFGEVGRVEGDSTWLYWLEPDPQSTTLTFGVPNTAQLTPQQVSWEPGQTVTAASAFLDAAGNQLRQVRVADCTTAFCASAFYAVPTAVGVQFVAAPADAGLVRVQRTQQILPSVGVTYQGAELYRAAQPSAFQGAVAWTVPATAQRGAGYELHLEVQVGAGTRLTAAEPFGVLTFTPAILEPAPGARSRLTDVTFTGRAPAGRRVELWVAAGTTPAAGQFARRGSTTATAEGYWTQSIPFVADGIYTVYLVVVEPDNTRITTPNQHLTIDTTAPRAPMVTASAPDYSRVELTWSGDPGELLESVAVYRKQGTHSGSLPGDALLLTKLAADATAYTDTEVAPATAYTYWVVYADLAGNTRSSTAKPVTTGAGLKLTTVTYTVPKGSLGHAKLATDLSIRAEGDAGHLAQALVDVEWQTGPTTETVVLTETAPGIYAGVLPVALEMQRITRIAAQLTHRTDANLRSPELNTAAMPLLVGGSLTGRVARVDNVPLPGLTVSVWSAATQSGAQAVTDSNGQYRVDGLAPAADYQISVQPSAAGTPPKVGPAAVTAGQVTANVNVVLPLLYSVTVQVHENGTTTPVEGAQVTLSSTAAKYLRRQVTAADGTTTFLLAPEAQDYLLYTEKAALVGFEDGSLQNKAIPGGFAPCDADPLLLCVDLPLIRLTAGTITGTVTDQATSATLEGVAVTAWSPSRGTRAIGWTDENGAYILPNLRGATDYVVRFTHPQYAESVQTGFSVNGPEVLDRALTAGLAISGVVTGPTPDLTPLAGVDVQAVGAGRTFWTRTAADGTYHFAQLPDPGTYTVTTSNGLGYLDQSQDATTGSIADFALELGTVLTGRVVTAASQPLAGALVEAVSAGGKRYAALSGASGTFTVAGLPGGTYTLVVTLSGYSAYVQPNLSLVNVQAFDLGNLTLTRAAQADPLQGTFRSDITRGVAGSAITYRVAMTNNSGAEVRETALFLEIPAGTTLVPGSVAVKGFPASTPPMAPVGADGRRFLRIFLGSLPAGGSALATYQVQVNAGFAAEHAITAAAEVSWLTDSASGTYARKVLGQARTELQVLSLNGPTVTADPTIRLYGLAPAGQQVQVLLGDAVLGQSQVTGRWWSMPVTLPAAPGTYTLTAQVVEPGIASSRRSAPLTVTLNPAAPVLTGATLTAGANGTVGLNAPLGVVTMAVPELTPMTLTVAFNDPAAARNVRFQFLNRTVPMALTGGQFIGTLPGNWSGSGQEQVVLHWADSAGNSYSRVVADILILIDPSGYVYELFPTAYLPGVTATLEQLVGGNWEVWDAALFGQVNPQVTGADGRYGWNVPAGTWRVIFTRPGYDAVTSQSVVVPPPVLDLNINLVNSQLPAVQSSSPANGAASVALSPTVEVTFSKYMRLSSLTATTVTLSRTSDGAQAAATLQPVSPVAHPTQPGEMLVRTIRLTPATSLQPGTNYTVTVDSLVADYAGLQPAAPVTWTFTTQTAGGGGGGGGGGPLPLVPPTVSSSSPADGTTDVPVDTAVTITFAAALNPESISVDTVQLRCGDEIVAATLTYDEATNTLRLKPAEALAFQTTYTVRLGAGLATALGGLLTTPVEWHFTTVKEQSPPPPPPPDQTHFEQSFDLGTLLIDLRADGTVAVEALVDAEKVGAFPPGETLTVSLRQGQITLQGDPQGRTVAIGSRAFSLPTALLTRLGQQQNRVRIETGFARLDFLPGAFGDLTAGPAGQPGARVRIDLNPVDAASLGASPGPVDAEGFRQVGAAVFVTATLVDGSGRQLAAIHVPSSVITLTIPHNRAAVPQFTAMFRMSQDGRWTYAGGSAAEGAVSATLHSFGSYAPREFVRTFSDVPPLHWAFREVQQMALRQVVRGYPDGSFDPNRQVTRAEFATLLVRALGLSAGETDGVNFQDVSPSDWFFAEVEAAAAAGFVVGNAGRFRPADPITRQEMAVVMHRVLTRYSRESVPNQDELIRVLEGYSDREQIAAWAREGAAVAAKMGLIRGRTDSTWNPLETATRAEASVILNRLLTLLQR